MNTLFDFISDVNAVQYGIALLSVVGFIVFCEILKPKPFQGLAKLFSDDAAYLRGAGRENSLRLIRNIAAAPAYLLIYIAAVPLLFMQGLTMTVGKGLVTATSAGWSPVRAYFTGRGKIKKGKKNDQGRES